MREERLRMVLGFCFGVAALAVGLASALVVGTTMVLPFVVVPRGRRERYTMFGARVWGRFVSRAVLFTIPRVELESPLPAGIGALIVCNHRSWLDPLVLIDATNSLGLSKMQVFWIPFVGLYGWLAGAVFFDRRDRTQRARARREVMQLVRSGHRIQLFPEGTRTRDGDLRGRVHLALVHDCFEAGLPVVPCAVHGTERTLPPGVPAAFPGQPFALVVGEALWPRDFPDAETFAAATWAGVTSRFERLRAADGTG